ncbi:MAG: hypothetical protein JNN13_03280 [Planctomycetes bacterium]|nr:hypothetical protein [Planctomycetota bacterium]
MRHLPPHLLPLFALLSLLPQEPAGKPAAELPPGVAELRRLDWLSGTWVMESRGTTTEEHWRPLQGTTLLGTSHTFDARRTQAFEFLRITLVRGKPAYVAQPGGGAPTVFVMTKLEDGAVTFENPEHDAPQRIRYERTDTGVTASISQLDGSRAMRFVFTKRE